MNHLEDRITVEHTALSDGASQELLLYLGPSSFEASMVSRNGKASVKVPACSLDEWFIQGERVDLVKLDIEGGEVKAVPGMMGLVEACRPLILFEVHDGGWPAVETLLDAGYQVFDLDFNALDRQSAKTLNHLFLAPGDAL